MTVRVYSGGATVQVIDEAVVTPPPVTGEVVLLGNAIYNQQRAYGPADRAKWSDLQALIDKVPAWDIFADAEQRLAPSWDGAEPTRSWVRCHQYGNFNRLYMGSPQPDGAAVRNLGSKANGDDLMLNIVPWVKSLPMRPGPRGKHMSTPFGAVRAHSRRLPDGTLSMHPDIPTWIKVDVLGNIWYYMRKGELRLPYTLKDVGGILDWCPVPSSRKEMLVADNGKGCVWHLLRDGANFTQTKYCDLPDVTSVISLPNGRHYAVDKKAVYEITSRAPVLTVNLSNAFYLDHFSNGDLCVGTLTPGLFRVTATGTVTPLYGAARLNSWVQCAVDRPGTCGPKDTIYFAGSHFGVNDNVIIVKPGQAAQTGTQVFGSVQGQMSVGPLIYTMDPFGHYPWNMLPHEDEAMFFVEGESDGVPSIWVRNAGQFPNFGVYDHNTFGTGIYIIRTGVDFSQPIGGVPSFTCQMSDSGHSGIGVCADVIAAMPFDEQAAFVQKGMAGSFPRPFLKGRSLYALLYHLNASSLRYMKEGGALLDNLKAYLLPTFGQELPALPVQYQGVPGSDTFVEVRNGKVAFMNNVENPKVVPSGLLVDVFVDEGLPGQQIIRGIASPWDVIIPSLGPGQHSIRPVVTNGDRTYWGRATVVTAP
jgi:hypothetical protein